MTITTGELLWHVTPVLIKNGLKHYVNFWRTIGQRSLRERTDDYFYDQIFHLAKSASELITYHTAEETQDLTNTSTPMPPWGTSERVMVSMFSCQEAARYLIQYFGPDNMHDIVGGHKWWQMRGLDGVYCEWICQNSDYHALKARCGDKGNIASMVSQTLTTQGVASKTRHERAGAPKSDEENERLGRVMLYIHGGGYYFGSINTHRYQILRIARKFGGFAFAVNYRKAPQFPFPCAIQDILAAYLYLIKPPPGAEHGPISPSRIVIAGDSAGGGLSLALLQVLRDLNLPQPAGAVLISPWSDLTHSFPSVLQNTKTDIIPPYSFIHRPSALWPLPPDAEPAKSLFCRRKSRVQKNIDDLPWFQRPLQVTLDSGRRYTVPEQIQLYATNIQLLHPLCSPALSGSLGGLPPLFVLAGNDEVLRDEIIYVAHKAAHPDKFTLRDELLDMYPNTRANQERYRNKPTKVHLQVYDTQCHVFTMFAKTPPATNAFRAIASFIKYVTGAPLDEAYNKTIATNTRHYYSGQVPLRRAAFVDNMIRERVSFAGDIRPLEEASSLAALRMTPDDVGRVREAALKRFDEGHQLWKKRYKGAARRAERKRQQYRTKVNRMLDKAKRDGLLDDAPDIDTDERQWRWLDLAICGPAELNEHPPPSAAVGRRDTRDTIALLDLSLRRRKQRRDDGTTAPLKHMQSISEVHKDPPPQYSVAERVPGEPGTPITKRFAFWKPLLRPVPGEEEEK
ncbi:hypothetical protein MCUN1_001176 [Malassezia cuniculi]|uniref:Alpha/beta hydrolase fold-3 domain-containing protein n=1 Tax=Malassezia cuniculi TaxID=948313 RepID=A0AAF0ETM8_9BASI|nr:hypothetical protein MCUN1_001176 [Malassezia cuniculi]